MTKQKMTQQVILNHNKFFLEERRDRDLGFVPAFDRIERAADGKRFDLDIATQHADESQILMNFWPSLEVT